MVDYAAAAKLLEDNNYLVISQNQNGDVVFCLPGLLGRHPQYTILPINVDPIPDSVVIYNLRDRVPDADLEKLLGHPLPPK